MHKARGETASWSRNNLEHEISLDYDAANRLANIEILDASQRLNNHDTLKHARFEFAAHREKVKQIAIAQ